MPASPLGTSKAARLPFHGSWKVDLFAPFVYFLSRNCFFQRGLTHKSTHLNDDVLLALGRERKCLTFFFERLSAVGHEGVSTKQLVINSTSFFAPLPILP